MNFIVTGFPRTGTSAMMAALEAGGMETEYIDIGAIAPRGVTMNLLGNRELWLSMVQQDNLHLYSGRVIKVIRVAPETLVTKRARSKRYRIILMKRSPEEMKRSWRLIMGSDYFSLGRVSLEAAVSDHEKKLSAVARDADHIESVTGVSFDDMLSDPTATFERLRDAGWPVDPRGAAAVVDPTVRRVGL